MRERGRFLRGLWVVAVLAAFVPVAADALCAACRTCGSMSMAAAAMPCHGVMGSSGDKAGGRVTSPCGFAAPMAGAVAPALRSAGVDAPAAAPAAVLPAAVALPPLAQPRPRAFDVEATSRDVPLYTLLSVLLI